MNLYNIFFGLLVTAVLAVGVYTIGPETVMDEARSFVGMEEATPAFIHQPVPASESTPTIAPSTPTITPSPVPAEPTPVTPAFVPDADLETKRLEVTCREGWTSASQYIDAPYTITFEGGYVTVYKNYDSVDLYLFYGDDGMERPNLDSPLCLTCQHECYTIVPQEGFLFHSERACVLSPLEGEQGPVEIKVNSDVYYLDEWGVRGARFSVREATEDEKCPGELG